MKNNTLINLLCELKTRATKMPQSTPDESQAKVAYTQAVIDMTNLTMIEIINEED